MATVLVNKRFTQMPIRVYKPEVKKDEKIKILFIGGNGKSLCAYFSSFSYQCTSFDNPNDAHVWLQGLSQRKDFAHLPNVVICDLELPGYNIYLFFKAIKKLDLLNNVIFIAVSVHNNNWDKAETLQSGFDDFYSLPIDAHALHERILFLKRYKRRLTAGLLTDKAQHEYNKYASKHSVVKRAFDILVSLAALLILSPVFLVIALIIKMESDGPVFYASKRAGKGYEIFNFYKFRSMRQGADEELKDLLHLNQYSENASFVKISNDPRITTFGRFLRNTSIDELPQLFNVLIGDMSIVGNRPLPLYEARNLTADQLAKRFLAPAGITGLWQVTKRGQKDMSEAERMQLDIAYADRHSFWMDMKLILQTIPALFQKETV